MRILEVQHITGHCRDMPGYSLLGMDYVPFTSSFLVQGLLLYPKGLASPQEEDYKGHKAAASCALLSREALV